MKRSTQRQILGVLVLSAILVLQQAQAMNLFAQRAAQVAQRGAAVARTVWQRTVPKVQRVQSRVQAYCAPMRIAFANTRARVTQNFNQRTAVCVQKPFAMRTAALLLASSSAKASADKSTPSKKKSSAKNDTKKAVIEAKQRSMPAPAPQPEETVNIYFTMEDIAKHPEFKNSFIECAKNDICKQDETALAAIVFLLRTWPDAGAVLAEEAVKHAGVNKLVVSEINACVPGFQEQYEQTHMPRAPHGLLISRQNGELVFTPAPSPEQPSLLTLGNAINYGVMPTIMHLEGGPLMAATIASWNGATSAEAAYVREDERSKARAPGALPKALLTNAASAVVTRGVLDAANDATGGNWPCLSYDKNGTNLCYYATHYCLAPMLVNKMIIAPSAEYFSK